MIRSARGAGAVCGGVVPWSGPAIVLGIEGGMAGAHPTHLAMAAKPRLPLAAFSDAPRRYAG